jgi:type I restriction enzyme M protein
MLSEQLNDLEQTLWQTVDTLRANSDLKSSEYSTPVLGLIFLKFADNKYSFDVTGLCKLATLDEVKEQEYSLNPGRYVGVVIEEDGKTEEEFIAGIVSLNDELEALNKEARKLESVIGKNIAAIAGEG